MILKAARGLMVLMLALATSACGTGAPAAAPTLTREPVPTTAPATAIPPTPTSVPQPTRPAHSIDLGYGRWLTTHSFEGQDQARNYSIKAQWPVVEGESTPQIERFNLAAQALVTDTLNSFQQTLPGPLTGPGEFFIYVNYQVISAGNGLLSILFDVSTYTGGAHSNTNHVPLNFDLTTGQPLTLDDVFKPGVDAVATLAVMASDELTRTNRLMFPEGAAPKPENYQVWNFDFNNLLITFEPYQVMPFSAGPQIVAIPYSRLKDELNPNSPLADFWQLTDR